MGFSYGYNSVGRMVLACDFCGAIGGVRKVKCPFGYCQAYAACPACRKDPEKKAKALSKEAHIAAGCDRLHAEFVASEKKKADLMAAGKPLNVSNLNSSACSCEVCKAEPDKDNLVHSIFRSCNGEVGALIPYPLYKSVREGFENVTLGDFEAMSPVPLKPAPVNFYGGL